MEIFKRDRKGNIDWDEVGFTIALGAVVLVALDLVSFLVYIIVKVVGWWLLVVPAGLTVLYTIGRVISHFFDKYEDSSK